MNVGCEKRCVGHGTENCVISEEPLPCREYPCGCICYDRIIGFEVHPAVLKSLMGVVIEPGSYYRDMETKNKLPKKTSPDRRW